MKRILTYVCIVVLALLMMAAWPVEDRTPIHNEPSGAQRAEPQATEKVEPEGRDIPKGYCVEWGEGGCLKRGVPPTDTPEVLPTEEAYP